MRNYTEITFFVIFISEPTPFLIVLGTLEPSFFFGSCALFPVPVHNYIICGILFQYIKLL